MEGRDGGAVYGRVDGKGTLRTVDGKEYWCETWQNGKMNGYGTYSRNGETVYRGGWKDGKRHGKGTHTVDRKEYSCESWRNNEMNGYGTYIYNGKTVYKGGWKNGKPHGDGVLLADKKACVTYEGKFRDGVFRRGKVATSDVVYVGMVDENMRPHGKMVFYYDSLMYAVAEHRGQWVHGRGEGVIRSVLHNGRVCSTVYKDGIPVQGIVGFWNTSHTYIFEFYLCNRKKIILKTATRAAMVIQQSVRGRKQRKIEAANDAALKIQGYARKWLRIHKMRLKKAGGTRKGRKAKPKAPKKPQEPENQDMGWCHAIKANPRLLEQMNQERQRRAAAAKSLPVKPSKPLVYALEIDLHGDTVTNAIERLRAAVRSKRLTKVPLKGGTYFWGYIRVITGKGTHGDYPRMRKEIRKTLLAWGASYNATTARDGNGTDGFCVEVTDDLRKHVTEALLAQTSPVRPGVRVA